MQHHDKNCNQENPRGKMNPAEWVSMTKGTYDILFHKVRRGGNKKILKTGASPPTRSRIQRTPIFDLEDSDLPEEVEDDHYPG